jgi:hypothetical protein
MALGVIIETVADPDAPNRSIRRARVCDPLRALKLTDREWAAAERLRDDSALATGYRERAGEAVRVDCGGGRVEDMTARQMDALRSMAWLTSGMVVSRAEWDVLQYVVVVWCSLAETGERLRIDPETVGRRLRRGLAGLSEFYG